MASEIIGEKYTVELVEAKATSYSFAAGNGDRSNRRLLNDLMTGSSRW